MSVRFLTLLLGGILAGVQAGAAAGAEETFPIRQYQIAGNRLLDTAQLQALVSPYTGPARTLDDIQAAQQAIENAYQAAGFGTVQAVTPEQELTEGIVRIEVVEARIQQVRVLGNQHFDEANIRASLPGLVEGDLPNLRKISENVQLANDNPAKDVEVVLSSLNDVGALEARVLVNDEKPLRFSVSFDNTGDESTGDYRLGIAVQHANLFDRDHVATIAYTTSPGELDKVDIYSVSYRLPVYDWGDSIDVIYGYSSVASGQSQTVAGPLNFSGDGSVFIARYNHYFARKGEYSSRLTLGWDHREYDNACDVAGVTCGSADADVTVRPLSLTWNGQWAGAGRITDFYASIAHNIPGGEAGDDAAFDSVRQGADASYAVLRAGGSLVRSFDGGWQGRAALNAQYSPDPLVPGEQIGLAGATAVRGFHERAVATDAGAVVNLELYSPSVAAALGLDGARSLRGLAFVDAAVGRNHDVTSSAQLENATLASAGLGLRADWSRRASLVLDVACVLETEEVTETNVGDVRAHLAVNFLF